MTYVTLVKILHFKNFEYMYAIMIDVMNNMYHVVLSYRGVVYKIIYSFFKFKSSKGCHRSSDHDVLTVFS